MRAARKIQRGDTCMLGPSGKILVVDDDEGVRDLCKEVLGIAGYRVETAGNGLDGLGKLRGSSYGLVISDVNMPELGGLEFYDMAVAACPGLAERFLFMTGCLSGKTGNDISGRNLACLSKPFRISELMSTVEGLMAKPLESALGRAGGQRAEGRIRLERPCTLLRREGQLSAGILDIAPRGMKAGYAGDPMEAGASLTVRLSMGLTIVRKAEVRWSAPGDGGPVSGFSFVEPLPAASIINMRAWEPEPQEQE